MAVRIPIRLVLAIMKQRTNRLDESMGECRTRGKERMGGMRDRGKGGGGEGVTSAMSSGAAGMAWAVVECWAG